MSNYYCYLQSPFGGIDYGLIEPIHNQNVDNGFSRVMPIWVQIAWSAVFILMILTAAAGNCIVIWIVIGKIINLLIIDTYLKQKFVDKKISFRFI